MLIQQHGSHTGREHRIDAANEDKSIVDAYKQEVLAADNVSSCH